MYTRTGAAALFAVLVLVQGASAHHGWSQYTMDQPLELVGTVREVSFEHPHVTIRLQTPQRVWVVVLPPPTRAQWMGLTPQTLRVGMPVTVVAYPHRAHPDEVRAVRITLEGRTIQLR